MRWIGQKQDKSFKGRLKRLIHRTSFGVVGLITATPFFMSSAALAAPNTTYTPHDFTSLSLTTDRTIPSGGFTVTDDLLTLNVDTSKANTSAHFYQTEGLQASLPASNSIKAKLFVSKDWQNKPVQAGIWGIAGNMLNSDEIGWPILQFVSNSDGFTGFRTFNTFTGDWTNVAKFNSENGWDKWYTMEINYNPQNTGIEFYVNNTRIGGYSANDGSDSFDELRGVIFNNFNTANNDPSDNYTVKWQGFETGVVTKGDKDTCKNGGYTTMTDENNQPFKNEGQCVSYMNGRPENGSVQPVTLKDLKF